MVLEFWNAQQGYWVVHICTLVVHRGVQVCQAPCSVGHVSWAWQVQGNGTAVDGMESAGLHPDRMGSVGLHSLGLHGLGLEQGPLVLASVLGVVALD